MNLSGDSGTKDYAERTRAALNCEVIMTAQRRIVLSSLSPHGPAGPARSNATHSNASEKVNENKRTLTASDAAALGMTVFYNWREKRLARRDPEGYARLQRLKALFRSSELNAAREKKSRNAPAHPLHYSRSRHKSPGAGMSH